MKLSHNTIKVLKNFAAINPNLVVNPGSVIKTISEAKTTMAEATLEEQFEKPFAIYDLNEFLGVFNLLPDVELEFNDDHVVFRSNDSTVNYRYSDRECCTTPAKDINLTGAEVSIELTEEVLSQINRAAAILGHPIVSFHGDGESVSVRVLDPKEADTCNKFTIGLGVETSHEFDLNCNIGFLKLLPGSYQVDLSSRLISKWTNTGESGVVYYVALDKSSKFAK